MIECKMCKLHVSHMGGFCNGKKEVCSQIYNNLDRTKLPDFLQDMSEERLKEIMEEDDKADCFGNAIDKMLHTDKKEQGKKKKGKN